MKKRLIVLLLGTTVLLSGCSKTGPTDTNPAVSADSATGEATSTPTPSPTPTPIPLPDNYINAPDDWTQIQPQGDGWVMTEWLEGHTSIIEWDSGKGGTIISSIINVSPEEAANKILTRFNDAVAANAYAAAGDCSVETVYFGNAIGFLIAPKWDENTYCCFVAGNISSGVGWDIAMTALSNYEKFAMYDYNLSKMLNVRIGVEGDIRPIDNGYWSALETKANEVSGWTEEANQGYRGNAQGIYKLIASQDPNVDVTMQSEGQSMTVYTTDGIRVTDLHLPDGFTGFEEYNNVSTKERYVYVKSAEYSLVVDGSVSQEYSDYLYDLVWNERNIVLCGADEEPEDVPEEDTEGEEGQEETGEEGTDDETNEVEEEPSPSPEPTESDEESEPVVNEGIHLIDFFDCGDGRVYMFAEVAPDTPADAKYSEAVIEGYTFVYYREDGLGCSMYVSTKIFDTKKKALDMARQLFL